MRAPDGYADVKIALGLVTQRVYSATYRAVLTVAYHIQ